ncbi:Morn repeat protein [Pandoravirus inopinatum]|uniref:Morn repeat protein n=1 Tax=Pandoravirus inopinatum TaxID=1605721 RepID=A0A0B5IWD8_9VIRU|nr:Morn repeat protein [Pandoravirus inopinatum]AJF97013.1 Morn repeat protein [Pandoravirus inopinatum]
MGRGRTRERRRRRGSTRRGLSYAIQEPVFHDPRLPSPFDDLPDEIVVAIVAAMGHDMATVARWVLTCRRHHALAMDATVWHHLCKVRFGPPLHRRFLDVGKTWRWLYEAQARVGGGDRAGPQTGAVLVDINDTRWVYWGDLVDGCPHGYGMAFPIPRRRTRCPVRVPDDGVVCQSQGRYEGYWQHGRRHGYGTGVADVAYGGATYDGHWKADKYHGHGVCVWPDVHVYEARGRRAPSAAAGRWSTRTATATRAIGKPTNRTATASTPGQTAHSTRAHGKRDCVMATEYV